MTIYQELKKYYPNLRFNSYRYRISPFNSIDKFRLNISDGNYWAGTFFITPQIRYIEKSIVVLYIKELIDEGLFKNYPDVYRRS